MEEPNTRQSSKLSLGSSPSILSGEDEPLEGPLSPVKALNDDELSALNVILQTGSPISFLNETREDDDSSLSSIADEYPHSRSASPEERRTLRKRRKENRQKRKESSQTEESSKKKRHYELRIDSTKTQNKNTNWKEKDQEVATKVTEERKVEIIQEEKIDCETTENDEGYRQRHKEALDALTCIELEFARLRDKMYQERLTELNNEAMMIENGTHPELLSLMINIQEKKERRISSAKAWRRHQYANFKRQYEGFEYQANVHFISQKNALRRDLLHDINHKKWSIEGERKKLNDLPLMEQLFPDGRALILHKRQLKEQASVMNELKESNGFPMAPNPTGLHSGDINDDLRLLGIIGRS